MPYPSSFTPYGMLTYSSRQSHARVIYDVLVEGLGDTFDTDSDAGFLEAARLYATAMALGSAQYQLDRAGNNRNPLKATELLGLLENDYQITPGPDATLNDRRRELAARAKVAKGNRRGAMEYALRTLLGDAFVEYRTTPLANVVAQPDAPGDFGVFVPKGTQKKTFTINEVIVTTGAPVTVGITVLGGNQPVAGEDFCVDPDPKRNIERVVLRAVTGSTITAIFTKAHEAGTVATRPHPYWLSNKRHHSVLVPLAQALDPETRRKVNELMARAVRGVSVWSIIRDGDGCFTPGVSGLDLPDCVPVA